MKKITSLFLLTLAFMLSSTVIFAQSYSVSTTDTDFAQQQQQLQTEHGPTVVVPPSRGVAAVGDDCTTPIVVSGALPLTYNDNGQTTCGRGNNYSTTGMGYYDGGEDIIYEVVLTEMANLTVTLNPLGTTYSGIGIFDACPDVGAYLGGVGSSSSSAKSASAILPAGTYYVMIDTWPSPTCIPSFNLDITAAPMPPPVSSYPYLETFTGTSIPAFWTNYGPDYWKFSGTAYFGANVDHTTGSTGNYAWVDDSSPYTNPSD
ncbi:MAG: hypothetical protein HQ521_15420, partial [Bacteroidetes bacterium]|nr:hypothetical protein [Bacteroidota bacterium]